MFSFFLRATRSRWAAMLLCCSLASTAAANPEGTLATLIQWMTGDFDNSEQFNTQPAGVDTFSYLGLQRRLVDAPALGEHVIYAQISRRADPDDVYRQSFMVFAEAEDGSITARNLRFVDEAAHRQILQSESGFTQLTLNDVRSALPEGCDPRWSFKGDHYLGVIDRDDCIMMSRRDGKPRHIQSTEFVYPEHIRNEESGYRQDGSMIFGLPEGQYYNYQRSSVAD